ncbi:MAG: alanine--tRNA ligase-related protein, partial [Ignisphaera sp.]
MVTELLYQKDSYIKEFTAIVQKVVDNALVLDRTAFNPRSGGLEHDTGILIKNGTTYRVVKVLIDKESGDVLHYLETPSHGIEVGD